MGVFHRAEPQTPEPNPDHNMKANTKSYPDQTSGFRIGFLTKIPRVGRYYYDYPYLTKPNRNRQPINFSAKKKMSKNCKSNQMKTWSYFSLNCDK